MTTENTALTVQARAAVALGSYKAETELVELASKSKSIVAITNKDGRTECHAAAMVAKDARVGIEKAGKAAREDATAFSKAVIAEEKRLVDLIEPEEKRLIGLRDEWDAARKAEKEAAEAAERARISAIQEKIELIKRGPMNATMLDAAGAETVLDLASEIEIDDSFGEFYGDAVEAKADAISKLREIVSAKVSAEATAARIKAEQEAEAARLAVERERMAAERAELDRQQAEQRAAEAKRQAEERARLDAERAELDRQRKELADAKAEQDRIAAEKADAERKAAALAEAEKLAAESAKESGQTLAEVIHAAAPEEISSALFTALHVEQPIEKVEPARESNSDTKRFQFRMAINAHLDAMTAVQLGNLLAYIEAQPLRERIAA